MGDTSTNTSQPSSEAPTSSKAGRRAARKQDRADKQQRRSPKTLTARNDTQKKYIRSLVHNELTIAVGPAGVGKTHIPSRIYAEMLVQGKISKIYVARPNVAKHKHRNGFLPGTAEEKTAPWLVPIFEAMRDAMSKTDFARFRKSGAIEEVPFEFIQGRTFRDAACIVDEAENLDMDDLYITLTRQGEDLRMVLCGDIMQARIPDSGLQAVADVAKMPHMKSTAVIEFAASDIVRSRQARQWAEAFADLLNPNYLQKEDKRGIDVTHESTQSLPKFVTG